MTDEAKIEELMIENARCVETIQKLIKQLEDCKNELCMNCGAYRREHLNACTGCRWTNECDI